MLYPLSYRGGGSIIPRSGVGTELEQICPPESPSVPLSPPANRHNQAPASVSSQNWGLTNTPS